MSATIDDKVVSMQFDNRQFERNVQTSLGTIEKLKQSLNFEGAVRGLDGIRDAASKCNMSGLSGAIDTVQVKFSALQIMAITALQNITDSAINAGKRITSALTIDPIKMGFQEYETQLNAVQTILANTESKGSTLDDVNNALDELNTYADKTIYNFTEMTRNIGTFTAAGVDLDTSVSSIKGIANLAAVSGSTSQQASTAMYQLSQALAAGRVSLMDWNSVVNAGMGGQVFQDALKRTAKNMGYNVDEIIEKYGSFRESLTQGEWLTTEVLTETLTQLSGAYSKADLIAQGYSEEQADQIVKLADTAVNAATKVKTFTQLIDTTKEALQSGWTQSWEIVIGDFEEAKALWTGVSNFLNDVIEKSAEQRNNLLQGWKDAGGRDMGIEAIKNAFQGLLNIIIPIKEAFREVFPPATSEQLVKITEKVKDLTANFKEASENAGPKLKNTFKGIFTVIKFGVNIVSSIIKGIFGFIQAISGLGDGILSVTGTIGGWISGLSETEKVADAISAIFSKVNDAVSSFMDSTKAEFDSPGFKGFFDLMLGIQEVIGSVATKIASVASSAGNALVDVFRNGDVKYILDIINGGLLAGLLVSTRRFVKGLGDALGIENLGFIQQVKGILDSVKESLASYQQILQAETLKKIATAIAILAASIVLIAMVDPKKLSQSLGAITVLFANLLASLAIFNKIGGVYPKAVKAVTVMMGISSAVLILAASLRAIASLSLGQLITGLVGVLGLTAIVVGAAKVMASGGKMIVKGASQMILMAAALKVMASACEDMSKFSWEELGRGLAGIVGSMVVLIAAMKLLNGAKFGAFSGAGIIMMATSMKILASAVKDFSGMSLKEIGTGLLGLAGSLLAITIAMNLMPKNMVSTGTGLLIISSAIIVLSKALKEIGSMSVETLAKGVITLASAMVILAVGLNAMKGTLLGSAAMVVAASALAILAPVLKLLGTMSWGDIAKGLVAIGGSFGVLAIAATLLSPAIPVILALSVAISAISLSVSVLMAALTASDIVGFFTDMVPGFTLLVTDIATALKLVIAGIIGMIPYAMIQVGEGIIGICGVIAKGAPAIGEAVKALVLTLVDVLVQCVPALADGALRLIAGLLASLAEYTPQIVASIFKFVIGLLNGLADYMPDLIKAGVNLIAQFFAGITQALSGLDVSTIINALVGVGLLTGLLVALGALSALIPSAMAGVLGMGILVAELALVLAAIGALAQVPGLQWLISEGGQFLQTVGSAIGKFVGGIVGGFSEGVSSSFPQIGSDLSAFMNNLQPFINGVKGIDSTMTEGVKALAETILILTAADILNGITSWLTGGASLEKFGKQLAPFGASMKSYADKVAGIDSSAVANSITAAKQLVKLADIIPNSGGLASIFAGDNDIDDFGSKMVSFGGSIAKYSEKVAGINTSAVSSSISSAKLVANFIKNLDGFSGSAVTDFKNALDTLGKASVDKFISAFTNSTSKLNTAGTDVMNAVLNGVKSKKDSAFNVGSEIANKIAKGASDNKSSFESAGKSLASSLLKGFKNEKSSTESSIKDMLTTMVNKIEGCYDDFKDAGKYLVKGFANGISANTFIAEARARAMAAAALEAAKAELDEASPSKEAYKIGDFFGQGFVNGISDASASVYKTSSNMASYAKDGLNDALNRIKGLINGDLDVTPTIRPVLDMTSIQNGVGRINGLFADQSIALANANASYSLDVNNLASLIDSLQASADMDNSKVVAAISELRSDFGELVTAISGLHIRMDSGAVVGQLIGKIDNSLGQIAIHKGRGN